MKNEHHLMLHGVAIKKYAGPTEIAEIIGVDVARVTAFLDEQVSKGRLVRHSDKYSLVPTTRVALAGEYSRHYDELRSNAAFTAAYEDFERINVRLKELITHWQMIEVGGAAIPNDHSNRAYDEGIIDRLGELHEKADRVLARLSQPLPRLQIYREKLLAALEKAERGAIEWVSDARIESFHTLWFELHEDLLCMMGRTRSE